jgi:hypothetical protein
MPNVAKTGLMTGKYVDVVLQPAEKTIRNSRSTESSMIKVNFLYAFV